MTTQGKVAPTHADLVERAARWLRSTKKCGVVLTEFVTSSPETPDAIGWTYGGNWSILVECKTSLSDFYADSKKQGRSLLRAAGLGRELYYVVSARKPPELMWGPSQGERLDEGFHSKAGRDFARANGVPPRKRLSAAENLATPPEFRDLLLSIARSCR